MMTKTIRVENQESQIFDFTSSYPFSLSDGNTIPTDSTVYVYCLVSRKYLDHIYIGETKCLSQRLIQHNSGSGSLSTQDIMDRPWAVAAFMCGLSHMTKIQRMSLERQWKILVQTLKARGQNNSFS